MKRKVNRVGQNTLTVSLPSKWVKEMGLKAGDEIDLVESDNQMVLNAGKATPKSDRIFTFDLTQYKGSDERVIRIIITHLYRKGYPKIKVKFKDRKDLDYIENSIRQRLVGMEITNVKENSCIIECFTEPEKDKFMTMMNRVFYINKEAMNLILADMRSGKYENHSRIKNYMFDVNKYVNYIRRLLHNEIVTKKEDSDMLWTISLYLIYMSSYYSRLYAYILDKQKSNIAISKETIKIFEDIIKLYELNHRLFQKPNYEDFKSTQEKYKKLFFDDMYKLISKTKGPENVVLMRLSLILRTIAANSLYCFSLSL